MSSNQRPQVAVLVSIADQPDRVSQAIIQPVSRLLCTSTEAPKLTSREPQLEGSSPGSKNLHPTCGRNASHHPLQLKLDSLPKCRVHRR
jgi:hypothetical protein